MKSNYPEFFDSDQAKLTALWAKATFAFDANSLLDFYRLSDDTIQKYFQAIESVKDRLFLPYQVDFEYSKNRRQVIGDQLALFPKIANVRAAIRANLSVEADDHRNPLSSMLDVLKKTDELDKVLLEIESLLEQEKKCFHVRATMTDGRLDRLFGQSVAVKPDNLDAMRATAKDRYSKLMPPGYIDDKTKHAAIKQECDSPKGKVLGDPFGDAIIWQELLESPYDQLIFVTGERKADWWLEIHGKRSPRPELIREMRERGKEFYLYSVESFIEHALKSLPKSEELSEAGIEAAVSEVRGLQFFDRERSNPKPGRFLDLARSQFQGNGIWRVPLFESMSPWRQEIEEHRERLISTLLNEARERGIDVSLHNNPDDILTLLTMGNFITLRLADDVRRALDFISLVLRTPAIPPSSVMSTVKQMTEECCTGLMLSQLI